MIFQISPSKLKVARCGRALDLLNQDTPPDTPEFENTLLGKEVHEILHEINCYDGVIDDIALDMILEKCCSHNFELQRRYALKYIDNFPYKSVAMSEFACGLDINLQPAPFETALYRGRIDALIMEDERRMCIVDHKSSYQIYNPDTEQMRFYAWLMSRVHPHIDEFVLSIYFLRYGEWRKTDYCLGRKAIANVERAMIVASQQAWNTQLGVPTPGAYCAFCPYAMSCPAAEKSISVVTSEQDAVVMAQKLHVLKKQVQELNRLLQGYAREAGMIMIDGETGYGYGEGQFKSAKVSDILEIAKQNPDALRALKADMRQVAKLKLDVPITTKYSSRWGAYKQGVSLDEND
jgi:hypothetical protein